MNIECEITNGDVIAFNMNHLRKSQTARRQYLVSWFLPATLWLFLCIGIWWLADRQRGTPLRTFLDLLPLFAGVPSYLIYFPWAYHRKLRKIVDGMTGEGKNKGLLGRRRITISDAGVMDAGEFGQSSTAWSAVERVAVTKDHAFIYINALAAIIIPRRAFPNQPEFDEFVRCSKKFMAQAGV